MAARFTLASLRGVGLRRPHRRAQIAQSLDDPGWAIGQAGTPWRRMRRRRWLWHMGARLEPLLDLSRTELVLCGPRDLIALAAMHAEAGRHTRAGDLVARAVRRDPGILSRCRYLGLTESLAATAPQILAQHVAGIERELDAARRFRAASGTFARMIRDAAGDVCIVGNAPAELGRGQGAFIDGHRLVVRFNDYSDSAAYRADYGGRCDIWVKNPSYVNIWRRPGARFGHVVIPNGLYWRRENGQDVLLDPDLDDMTVEEMPVHLLAMLTRRLGARPSSGIRILAWVDHVLGGLDAVTVRGFSFTDQTDRPVHYFEEIATRRAAHDWARERELCDRLVQPRRIVPSG